MAIGQDSSVYFQLAMNVYEHFDRPYNLKTDNAEMQK